MSGQYELTTEEMNTILEILNKHGIDYTDNEVSIQVSSYEEREEDMSGYNVNPYIQVN